MKKSKASDAEEQKPDTLTVIFPCVDFDGNVCTDEVEGPRAEVLAQMRPIQEPHLRLLQLLSTTNAVSQSATIKPLSNGTYLVDAKARNAEHPMTFTPIPPDCLIKALAPGCLVKIIVEYLSKGGGERFWVHVTERDGDHFLGRVDNELLDTDVHGLKFGDFIRFKGSNITDVWMKEDQNEQASTKSRNNVSPL